VASSTRSSHWLSMYVCLRSDSSGGGTYTEWTVCVPSGAAWASSGILLADSWSKAFLLHLHSLDRLLITFVGAAQQALQHLRWPWAKPAACAGYCSLFMWHFAANNASYPGLLPEDRMPKEHSADDLTAAVLLVQRRRSSYSMISKGPNVRCPF
jgi:hypothetical protein